MEFTGVHLALYLALAASALLMAGCVCLRRVLMASRMQTVRALIKPYRAMGWAVLPEPPGHECSGSECVGKTRAPPDNKSPLSAESRIR